MAESRLDSNLEQIFNELLNIVDDDKKSEKNAEQPSCSNYNIPSSKYASQMNNQLLFNSLLNESRSLPIETSNAPHMTRSSPFFLENHVPVQNNKWDIGAAKMYSDDAIPAGLTTPTPTLTSTLTPTPTPTPTTSGTLTSSGTQTATQYWNVRQKKHINHANNKDRKFIWQKQQRPVAPNTNIGPNSTFPNNKDKILGKFDRLYSALKVLGDNRKLFKEIIPPISNLPNQNNQLITPTTNNINTHISFTIEAISNEMRLLNEIMIDVKLYLDTNSIRVCQILLNDFYTKFIVLDKFKNTVYTDEALMNTLDIIFKYIRYCCINYTLMKRTIQNSTAKTFNRNVIRRQGH